MYHCFSIYFKLEELKIVRPFAHSSTYNSNHSNNIFKQKCNFEYCGAWVDTM